MKKLTAFFKEEGIVTMTVSGLKDLYGQKIPTLAVKAKADEEDLPFAKREVGKTLCDFRMNKKLAGLALKDTKLKMKICKAFHQSVFQKNFKTSFGAEYKENFTREEVNEIVQKNIQEVKKYSEKMLSFIAEDIITLKEAIKDNDYEEKNAIKVTLPMMKKMSEKNALEPREEVPQERMNAILDKFRTEK